MLLSWSIKLHILVSWIYAGIDDGDQHASSIEMILFKRSLYTLQITCSIFHWIIQAFFCNRNYTWLLSQSLNMIFRKSSFKSVQQVANLTTNCHIVFWLYSINKIFLLLNIGFFTSFGTVRMIIFHRNNNSYWFRRGNFFICILTTVMIFFYRFSKRWINVTQLFWGKIRTFARFGRRCSEFCAWCFFSKRWGNISKWH